MTIKSYLARDRIEAEPLAREKTSKLCVVVSWFDEVADVGIAGESGG